MDRSIYDTKEGIATMLDTLDNFRILIRARKEAGCRRGEKLNKFWILGRFCTDTVGNMFCYKPDYFPANVYATLPKVLTELEFEELVAEKGTGEAYGRQSGNLLLPLVPPSHVVDPLNNKGWTPEDCHDVFPVERREDITLNPWVGKTFLEFKQNLAQENDGEYGLFTENVRNESLIDLTPNPERHYLAKNKEGWRPKDEVTDDYIIQAGDRTILTIVRFYHEDTLKIYEEKQRRAETPTWGERIMGVIAFLWFTLFVKKA